jgi:hypothetical protein
MDHDPVGYVLATITSFLAALMITAVVVVMMHP